MHAERAEEKTGAPQDARSWKTCVYYILNILLTTAVVMLVIGEPWYSSYDDYRRGMLAKGLGFDSILFIPLAVLISVVIVILAVVRILFWSRTTKRIILTLVFPIICLLVFFVPSIKSEPGAAVYLRGYEQWVLKNVDIEAIQQWLQTDGIQYAGHEYYRDPNGFPKGFPACLVSPHPHVIQFSDVTPGQGVRMELLWYQPIDGCFGIIIGPPSMETPKEGMIRFSDRENEFRRPVKPGAYVVGRG